MKRILLKVLKYSSSLAVFTAILSANTACTWYVYQPEVPKAVKQLKK